MTLLRRFRRAAHEEGPPRPRCSFCGKSRDEVRKLVAGPRVYICDECVALCGDILTGNAEGGAATVEEAPAVGGRGLPATLAAPCALCRIPSPRERLTVAPDRGFLCDACMDAIRAGVEAKGDHIERGETMLELRPTCEHCNRALPPETPDARICSFECTFCATCVDTVLGNVCPNCGGGFAPRPIRPARNWKGDNHLGAYPASTKVKHRPVDPAAHARFAQTIRAVPPERR